MSDLILQDRYTDVRAMQLQTAEVVPFSASFLEFVFLRGLEVFAERLSVEQRGQLDALLTVYAGAARVRDGAVFVGVEVEALVEAVGGVSMFGEWGV